MISCSMISNNLNALIILNKHYKFKKMFLLHLSESVLDPKEEYVGGAIP